MALTPGLVVQTSARSGPAGVVLAPSGNYFVLGITERGPVDKPVKINSLSDYRRVFGERVTYGAVYDDVQVFFESGGAQAFVQRVVGAAATVAGALVLGVTQGLVGARGLELGYWALALGLLVGAAVGRAGEQTRGSAVVLKTMEAIRAVSEEQARTVRQLEEAIAELQHSAEVLRGEVRRFRL